MKTKTLLIIVTFIALSINVYAQLSVNSRGNVSIGAIQDTSLVETDTVSAIHIYGNSASSQRLCIGIGKDVYIGKTGTLDQALELQGKTGFYLKAGQFLSTPVAFYDDYLGGSSFIFNTDVAAMGFSLYSDMRLKKDIRTIETTLDDLSQLRGVSFKYKKESPNDVLKRMDDRTKYGLIAQEVEMIYPELVKVDKDGYKMVDYIGLIPVLINAINELNRKIIAIESETNEMNKSTRGGNGDKLGNDGITKLYQNSPNPFSITTEIKYKIPESVKHASLHIYDMQGQEVKIYHINSRGEGSISVASDGLKAGMYLYALIADDVEIDMKRMILTK